MKIFHMKKTNIKYDNIFSFFILKYNLHQKFQHCYKPHDHIEIILIGCSPGAHETPYSYSMLQTLTLLDPFVDTMICTLRNK